MFIGSNIHIGTLALRGSGAVATSYLLDTYPAFAAYSTRQLSSTATDCMIVTEGGTGTEATIGFSAGWVDEAAIATHCGANNGTIAQWFDQSGNSYHAAQNTDNLQGFIYNGTSVTQVNGKPSALRQNNQTYWITGTLATVTQPVTVFGVWRYANGGNQYFIDGSSASEDHRIGYAGASLNVTQVYAGASLNGVSLVTDSQLLQSALLNSTSSVLRRNGAEEATGNCGTEVPTKLTLGNQRTLLTATNELQEVIYYNSDQSANFAAIETDINTAFSVYA